MRFAIMDSIAPSDANWYLSTTAQSAAALVAIIGGFILQKTISLNASISAHHRRKNVLLKKREITERQIKLAKRILLLSNTKRFFNHHLIAYAKLKNGEDVNFQILWRIYHPWDLEPEDDSKIEKQLKAIVLGESTNVQDDLSSDHPNAPSSLSSLGEAQMDLELREFISKRLNNPDAFREIGNSEGGRALRAKRVSNLNNLKYELELIDADIEGVNSDLDDRSEKHHLLIGFIIVFLFGACGVLLPLTFMAEQSPDRLSTTSWIYGFFLIGYLSLVFFVFFLIRLPKSSKNSVQNQDSNNSLINFVPLDNVELGLS